MNVPAPPHGRHNNQGSILAHHRLRKKHTANIGSSFSIVKCSRISRLCLFSEPEVSSIKVFSKEIILTAMLPRRNNTQCQELILLEYTFTRSIMKLASFLAMAPETPRDVTLHENSFPYLRRFADSSCGQMLVFFHLPQSSCINKGAGLFLQYLKFYLCFSGRENILK